MVLVESATAESGDAATGGKHVVWEVTALSGWKPFSASASFYLERAFINGKAGLSVWDSGLLIEVDIKEMIVMPGRREVRRNMDPRAVFGGSDSDCRGGGTCRGGGAAAARGMRRHQMKASSGKHAKGLPRQQASPAAPVRSASAPSLLRACSKRSSASTSASLGGEDSATAASRGVHFSDGAGAGAASPPTSPSSASALALAPLAPGEEPLAPLDRVQHPAFLWIDPSFDFSPCEMPEADEEQQEEDPVEASVSLAMTYVQIMARDRQEARLPLPRGAVAKEVIASLALAWYILDQPLRKKPSSASATSEQPRSEPVDHHEAFGDAPARFSTPASVESATDSGGGRSSGLRMSVVERKKQAARKRRHSVFLGPDAGAIEAPHTSAPPSFAGAPDRRPRSASSLVRSGLSGLGSMVGLGGGAGGGAGGAGGAQGGESSSRPSFFRTLTAPSSGAPGGAGSRPPSGGSGRVEGRGSSACGSNTSAGSQGGGRRRPTVLFYLGENTNEARNRSIRFLDSWREQRDFLRHSPTTAAGGDLMRLLQRCLARREGAVLLASNTNAGPAKEERLACAAESLWCSRLLQDSRERVVIVRHGQFGRLQVGGDLSKLKVETRRGALFESAVRLARSTPGSSVGIVIPVSVFSLGGGFLWGRTGWAEEEACMRTTLFRLLRQAASGHAEAASGEDRDHHGRKVCIPECGVVQCSPVRVFRQSASRAFAPLSGPPVELTVFGIWLPNLTTSSKSVLGRGEREQFLGPALGAGESRNYTHHLRQKFETLLHAASPLGLSHLFVSDERAAEHGIDPADLGKALAGALGTTVGKPMPEVLATGSSAFCHGLTVSLAELRGTRRK